MDKQFYVIYLIPSRLNSEKELAEFMENDPAIQINRFEYYPMKAIVHKHVKRITGIFFQIFIALI